jgi:hypothetical protein
MTLLFIVWTVLVLVSLLPVTLLLQGSFPIFTVVGRCAAWS